MSLRYYIGLDPGKNGGIAVVGCHNPYAHKMPDSLQDIWDLLKHIRDDSEGNCFALLERVHSSPAMGVVSAFTFGRGYGGLEMALTGVGISHEIILPQKWQKELGCLSGGQKNITKARAQGLFPSIKCTHSVSDALLIAEYGRRKYL